MHFRRALWRESRVDLGGMENRPRVLHSSLVAFGVRGPTFVLLPSSVNVGWPEDAPPRRINRPPTRVTQSLTLDGLLNVKTRRRLMQLGMSVLALPFVAGGSSSQPAPNATLPPTLESLLATPGLPLEERASEHFWLYSELRGTRNARLLDSLEEALTHATELLGVKSVAQTPVPVIVTTSRTRFSPLISPSTKGFRSVLANGSSFIVLVVNDSVRAYTRHEVMHDVAFKHWGLTYDGGSWLSESPATFADGRCQGVPNITVARDLLNQNPQLTLADLTSDLRNMNGVHRHASYVLGASVIEFLWQRGGRDAVRRLWQTGDWPSDSAASGPPLATDLSSAWRSFVTQRAGNQAGLDVERLRRNGCG